MERPKFVPTMQYCPNSKKIFDIWVFEVCVHMQFDECWETKYENSLACAGHKNVYSISQDVGRWQKGDPGEQKYLVSNKVFALNIQLSCSFMWAHYYWRNGQTGKSSGLGWTNIHIGPIEGLIYYQLVGSRRGANTVSLGGIAVASLLRTCQSDLDPGLVWIDVDSFYTANSV